MRIRFTLDITRTPRPDPTEAPDIYDLSGASVERAGEQSLGFQVQPPNDPAYDRR
jgi:hypothetical protein